MEARRGNADDGVRSAVRRSACGRRRRRCRRTSCATSRWLMIGDGIVGGAGQAPGCGHHSEVAEEVLRDLLDSAGSAPSRRRRSPRADPRAEKPTISESTWLCARSGSRTLAREGGEGLLESEARTRRAGPGPARSGSRNRQRAKQQIVDQAEQRRVGADAERERQRRRWR